MNVEEKILYNRFKFRDYQKPVVDAFENKKFRKIMLIWPRRCIHEDSIVVLSDLSLIKIKDLKPGMKVLSYSRAGHVVEDTVKFVWSTGEKELISIKAERNMKLVASRDHRFAIKKDDTVSFIKASRLSPDDELVILDSGLKRIEFRKIESLDYYGTGETYDIQTRLHHNFFANGYLVHNSGKDILSFQLAIRQALRRTCNIFYIFPTSIQARKAIWDAVSIDGNRILDLVPEVIAKRNQAEMKLSFLNGSTIQFVGSMDAGERLRGSNPYLVIFSEFAFSNPESYDVVRPILAANGGAVIFCSTPNGLNKFHDLYQIAKNSDDWFCSRLTVEDTQHIDPYELESERSQMSEDMFMQEYMTSFDVGARGSYYGKIINQLELDGRISNVPWEPNFPVHTSWDLGYSDNTSIIFFQKIGTSVHVIDFYEDSKKSLEYYIKYLDSKPYKYGMHIAPHDIANHSFSTGVSRIETARSLGVNFIVAPNIPLMDGIEAVRVLLPKCYFDRANTSELVKHLSLYHQEWDSAKQVYKQRPSHDLHCFTGDTLIKTPSGDVRIDNVSVGDSVITPSGVRRVVNKFEYDASELYTIRIGDDVINCTATHEFFTDRGLIEAKDLVSGDVVYHYSKVGLFLWKRIYGLISAASGIKGFKRIFSYLKTGTLSYLMDSHIDGMRRNIIKEHQGEKTTDLRMQEEQYIKRYNAQYGRHMLARYLKDMLYTIKTAMREIIGLKILNVLRTRSISVIMQSFQIVGLNQRSVRICSESLQRRQGHGIVLLKGLHGTKSTPENITLESTLLSLRKHVSFVVKNILGVLRTKSIAQRNAKTDRGLSIEKILSTASALYAEVYLSVINILSRKHVVQSVSVKELRTSTKVYDIEVDVDHCYYANNSLVSNSHACDSFRYLAVSINKLNTGLSAEELKKRYKRAMYGNSY